jgi:hypothetical protein
VWFFDFEAPVNLRGWVSSLRADMAHSILAIAGD